MRPAQRPSDGPREAPKYKPKKKKQSRIGKQVYYHDRPDDLMALFKRLDRDGSGKLTARELEPLAKQMGVSGKDLALEMDKNGDKQADWPEFRRYLRRK